MSVWGRARVVVSRLVRLEVVRTVTRRSLAVMLGGLSLLGPVSIDAYLPAFADIQRDFQASTADLQLTLTGYLLAFACMSLLHGALSDAFWAQAGDPLRAAGVRAGGTRM